MSEPVTVWFVARHYLRGPAPALARVSWSKSGASAWAELVEKLPGARFPWAWYEIGHRYKIGSTVFLTELAAQRFLEGEADRRIKTASSYMRSRHPHMLDAALKVPHPDVYRKK